MRKSKIFVITFFITIIFGLIIHLVAPSDNLEEQKNAKQLKIEDTKKLEDKENKNQYKSIINNVYDSNGTEIISIKSQKQKDTLNETSIKSGDKLVLKFLIVKDHKDTNNEDSKYVKITKEEFENINFDNVDFKTDRNGIDLVNPSNIHFDESNGLVSVKVTLQFEDHVSYIYPEEGMDFEMLSIGDKKIVKGDNTKYLFKLELPTPRVTTKDDGTVKGRDDTAASKEVKNETSWTKETYTEGEDTTIPINDGNIEDWEHILDDWEIEEGIMLDGEGIYD